MAKAKSKNDTKDGVTYDVIIVGAGVAGLACAQILSRNNVSFLILEGRARLGGRILTHREPHLQTPIELGAEFIHGVANETFSRLESEGLNFHDVLDTHFLAENGKLKNRDNFWDQVSKIMDKLDPEKDRTFAEFLREENPGSAEQRKFAIGYVEGFHGADTDVIGEKGLSRAEQSDEEDLNGATQFRPTGGYDQFISGFVASLPDSVNTIRLSTIVKKLKWKKNSVEVECVTATGGGRNVFRAKHAVITVPIGVLKADSGSKAAIEFSPTVPTLKKALDGIEMGHCLRIALKFRTRFWESLSKQPIGFLHTGPDHEFPTWWTLQPVRAPVLVAWQGGPKAQEIAARGEPAAVDGAMKTLSYMTGKSLKFLYEQLQASYFHDWDKDSFSLGSYSYVASKGWGGAEALSKDVMGTLYFAGEATDMGPARGTVNGALASGERVANRILLKIRRK